VSRRGAATTEEEVVKYMLMIYNNPALYESWSEEERKVLFGGVDVLVKEMTDAGELLSFGALADASQAKTVRVRDGVPATTDGPFAEAKEQLAGYMCVEVDSEARALDLAARWPDAKYFAMEVRPLMHSSGDEM
jgi:hypothetical protein